MIQFDLPKEQSSILKVIGIGGGGGNAVNHMYGQNIEGVNFIICNTDAQALSNSDVPNKIQLGPHLTQGLGAGANPVIGREATEESLEEIRRILEVNTKMAFITAGMGGGTGTGGAPIVARICKDLGILTVGIVTTPFNYEGKKRMAQAVAGIETMKDHVDTLLVISNDKLRHQFGNLTMKAAFAKADNVLATAAKCITDVINSTGQINVDFADVCTVMRDGGVAILGNAACEGEDRARKAIEQALTSPLLNDNDISGAKWILININSSEGEHEFTMDEVDTIQTHLLSKAGEDTDVILGMGYDNSLGNKIGITLIATGFEEEETRQKKKEVVVKEDVPVKEILELKPVEKKSAVQPLFLFDEYDETVVDKVEEPQEEPEKTGLREDQVMKAIEEEEAAQIVEELKPEILPSEPEVKMSIMDFVSDSSDDEETERDIVIFELSSEPENVPDSKTSVPAEPVAGNKNQVYSQKPEENVPLHEVSKKSQFVYVEKAPVQKTEPVVKPAAQKEEIAEEEVAEEMKLIEKGADAPAEKAPEKETIHMMFDPIDEKPEEKADEREIEEQKALERINKLRNLSYNPGNMNPNDDFENVPAYKRRNIDLHNSIANVESFYSNYTLNTDDSDKAKINTNTINSFLQGKRPD